MRELETIRYEHDGVMLEGRLARPDGEGQRPGILVMHDAIGIGTLVERKTKELADQGYVALASDMYGPELYSGEPEVYGRLFVALQEQPDRLRSRVLAGYQALRAQPGIDPSRIVAIGYCFGGQCVLELARSGAEVRAVASFHGLLTSRLPARPGEMKARVLAITGAKDPYAPATDVTTFEAEMTEADADWQVTVYGRGWHAFTDPEVGPRNEVPGVRYDPLLNRLSWAAAQEFLTATLAE